MALLNKKIAEGVLVATRIPNSPPDLLGFTRVSQSSDHIDALAGVGREYGNMLTISLLLEKLTITGDPSPTEAEELSLDLFEATDLLNWTHKALLEPEPTSIRDVGLYRLFYPYAQVAPEPGETRYFRIQFNISDPESHGNNVDLPYPQNYDIQFEGTCWATISNQPT